MSELSITGRREQTQGVAADTAGRTRPQVVVVGAGFAGLNATHALRGADADVTLVDKNNYHTFQPLLYQVRTGYLAVEEVGTALRSVFRRQSNVTFRMAAVTSADWDKRSLVLGDGSALGFDYLILAGGAETKFFGVPGMEEHAWPLYTLDDAVRLRMHLLAALERVARRHGSSRSQVATVVVGGGPTGVETAGALASMAQEILGPDISLQVTLIEAGPRLLSGFSPPSSDYALADLRRRGVDVRLNRAVKDPDAEGVSLASGERIATDTVIWAAGVQANTLAQLLGLEVSQQGRIVVDPQLQVPGHPNVFAAGDMAAATVPFDSRAVPMMAPTAIQTGRHAGEQVTRLIQGRPLRPFRYRDKGMMAVLGRGDAVAELPLPPGIAGRGVLRFGGLPAWLLWLVVHIVYLIGFRNRIKVLVDWGWSYFTSRGAAVILIGIPDEPPRRPDHGGPGVAQPTTAREHKGSEPTDVLGR
ncbi:MAG: NAD(P)/FAD-dependent oxidoreductase [Acidimicrobiales bacterium]